MILRPISDNRGQITNVVYSCQVLSDHAEVVRVNPANLTPMLETAHHLNNVLQMLMANADLTCTALPPEHPLRSRMQDIKASAHRAGALGRLLLDCEPIKAAASACSAVAVPVHRNSERQMSASDDNAPTSQNAGPATLPAVEDEAPVRESMVEFLARSGHNVLAASPGEEALERSKSAAIDLVITDVAVPRMSGQQVAGALTAFHPGHEDPVRLRLLAMSGPSSRCSQLEPLVSSKAVFACRTCRKG